MDFCGKHIVTRQEMGNGNLHGSFPGIFMTDGVGGGVDVAWGHAESQHFKPIEIKDRAVVDHMFEMKFGFRADGVGEREMGSKIERGNVLSGVVEATDVRSDGLNRWTIFIGNERVSLGPLA